MASSAGVIVFSELSCIKSMYSSHADLELDYIFFESKVRDRGQLGDVLLGALTKSMPLCWSREMSAAVRSLSPLKSKSNICGFQGQYVV